MDPKELINNPEQLKNLISLLQSLLPDGDTSSKTEQDTETVSPVASEETDHPHNMRTKNKRVAQNSFVNKFEKMSEFNMHKEDKTIDEKLSKVPPVARTREFEPAQVICRVCGKKEVVSPSLVYDNPSRYKCNNCATQAG